MKILEIPEYVEELKIASQNGLVPFIGAGVSALAGAPSWSQFADAALMSFKGVGIINHSRIEQLKHLNPRVRLSIAIKLQEEHKKLIPWDDILKPKTKDDEDVGKNVYGFLSALSTTFITTNYDNWLKQPFPLPTIKTGSGAGSATSSAPKDREIFASASKFTIDMLKENTVFKLHGSVENPSEMILTTKDYTKHYANDTENKRNPVNSFLRNLFKQRSVLFIGYGLEELEILEYIIQNGEAETDKKHFILQGFFSHEVYLAETMSKYFLHQCGVRLIPFLKDHKNWKQLIDVLEDFAEKYPISPPSLADDKLEMKALLT